MLGFSEEKKSMKIESLHCVVKKVLFSYKLNNICNVISNRSILIIWKSLSSQTV